MKNFPLRYKSRAISIKRMASARSPFSSLPRSVLLSDQTSQFNHRDKRCLAEHSKTSHNLGH